MCDDDFHVLAVHFSELSGTHYLRNIQIYLVYK